VTGIGIMQGRLLPPVDNRIQCFPRDSWTKEFALAAQAGLDSIEWIYDLYGADINPLSTDAGIDKMRALSAQHGVKVFSVCADYFMDRPLMRANASELEERLSTLAWLMHRCRRLSINRLVLPFVDSSRIDTDAEIDSVVLTLKRALRMANETGIEIHLETSLPPSKFAELLAKFPHPMLKVNYDSGNSASLGYNPYDEFACYGMRVGSVHIKDRILRGNTVPLGKGDGNFVALFDCLRNIGYSGDFILQTARGVAGDEIAWAKQNRAFILAHWVEKI